MRNCPHCGKEIQDEAAFCRFCRRDVEPPLWLTSLQKCPYCAEWVERGIERCPLCGKVLVTEEPFYISEEADSTERLLNEVRQNIFAKDKPESDEELESEDQEEELAQEEDIAHTPAFTSIPREIERDPAPSDDPYESQEGLGVLRERQRKQIPLDPLEDLSPRAMEDPVERQRVRIPFGKIVPWILLIIATISVVGIAVYAVQELDLLDSFTLAPAPSPSQAASPIPSETVDSDSSPTATIGAAILPPDQSATATPSPCMLWSDVTPAMEGQQACVYGVIKRRFRVDSEIPYMAIFSEEEGSFAIVDRLTFYTQFRPGDCIQADGEVEIMRGTRPFIDAGNALIACPTSE